MRGDSGTREQRLAAALRDNLRKRKAQARQVAGRKGDPPDDGPDGDAGSA